MRGEQMPRISVIICCRGQLEQAARVIQPLQVLPGCEFLLVDEVCDDGAVAWLRQHFPAVCVVRGERHTGANAAGASAWNSCTARNRGAA